MKIDTGNITQHVMFWLLIAFLAGFGFAEVATRANINPLRSSANLAGPDTRYCANWMFGGADPYYFCNPEINYTNQWTATDVQVLPGETPGAYDDDGNFIPGSDQPGWTPAP